MGLKYLNYKRMHRLTWMCLLMLQSAVLLSLTRPSSSSWTK